MRHQSKLKTFAIVILMIVSALSLTGVIVNTYATPLIIFSISGLLFVLGYESIVQSNLASARRFIIVGLILFIAALGLFIIGNF